ncbi:hypothetical protein ACHAXM_004580 [Skeletonema potamos]
MTSKLSMIIAALLLSVSPSPALGFAPPASSSCSSRSCCVPELRSIPKRTGGKCYLSDQQMLSAASLTIQWMASNGEDPEKAGDATDDVIISSKDASNEAATAGGGTIAITSAKSAADAATASSTSIKSSSPSNTGFSLILLPTLLFKFTIVLIVKFATDVVVYPVLFLWRWARLGKKKIGKGLARMFGRKKEINGTTIVNGDSVGEFQ